MCEEHTKKFMVYFLHFSLTKRVTFVVFATKCDILQFQKQEGINGVCITAFQLFSVNN